MIDLVVTKHTEGYYTAIGGSEECLFGGNGSTEAEAIGSWFIANRESADFQFVSIIDGQFKASSKYNRPRNVSDLGDNELQALKEFNKEKEEA